MNALRVLIASGFGALVGSLASLELLPLLALPLWLWPLCALFGGVTGYLAYDPKLVIRAVKDAFRVVYDWKPRPLYWRVLFGWCALVGLFLAQVFAPVFVTLWFMENTVMLLVVAVSVFFGIWVVFFSLFVGATCMSDMADYELEYIHSKNKRECLGMLPWKREYWFYALVRGMPGFMRRTAMFIKLVFVAIHSDARTTCFTGGLLGTAVGVFVGSWLIGAVAGAVIGLVSYVLIGKRWLKTTSS